MLVKLGKRKRKLILKSKINSKARELYRTYIKIRKETTLNNLVVIIPAITGFFSKEDNISKKFRRISVRQYRNYNCAEKKFTKFRERFLDTTPDTRYELRGIGITIQCIGNVIDQVNQDKEDYRQQWKADYREEQKTPTL